MSQMPDKLWLHKDTKYNTGDIVYGYQYEFAEGIEDEGGIDNFVEYTSTDACIEKACEWLENNVEKYYYLDEAYDKVISIKNLNNDFKKYMKGG